MYVCVCLSVCLSVCTVQSIVSIETKCLSAAGDDKFRLCLLATSESSRAGAKGLLDAQLDWFGLVSNQLQVLT